MKPVLAVIPARFASSRLPEKPLKDIHGKTLVQRAWERAKGVKSVARVVVATDDQRVFDHVRTFGGEVIMTEPELACGSERVRRAAELLAQAEGKSIEECFSIVVNNQGDMPFLPPDVVDGLVGFLRERQVEFQMATVVSPMTDEQAFLSPHSVKAVVSERFQALYFSRAPIPYPRGDAERMQFVSPACGSKVYGFHHYGLYAFTPAGLRSYSTSKESPLEQVEKLEQLRVLESGGRIGVHIVPVEVMKECLEVNTPEDLEKAIAVAQTLERPK